MKEIYDLKVIALGVKVTRGGIVMVNGYSQCYRISPKRQASRRASEELSRWG